MHNTYVGILKKYAVFNSNYTIIPVFFPQKSINPSYLKDLRDTYKLKKVAGNGSDISQILNTLFWLNKNIKHDGCSYNKMKITNAKSILEFSIKENIGLNCHMIALLLNEIYLSLGFKSTYIFCNPYDENDVDCHVINIVFVQSINKWIWIDGTYNIYLTDSEGQFLDIIDVRNMIVTNKINCIKVNVESKFGKLSVFDGSYLDYMCKNLVWFERPINNRMNNNLFYSKLSYLRLLPINYNNVEKNANFQTTHNINYFFFGNGSI